MFLPTRENNRIPDLRFCPTVNDLSSNAANTPKPEPNPSAALDGADSLSPRVRWAISLLGILAVAGALLGGFLVGGRAKSPPIPPDRPRQLDGFTLTERSGRVITRRDLRGKICVVNFVSTSCGMGCYDISRRMAELQAWVKDQPDVQLVSLTVDPRSNSPATLQRFAKTVGADPERWWFLTGDPDVLFPFIEISFLPKRTGEDPSLIPGGFGHADQIVLVDASGAIRSYFDGNNPATPISIFEEIRRLR